MSGCDEFTVFTEERRVVIGKCHRHGRFVDGDSFQWFRILNIGDRISNLETFDTDQYSLTIFRVEGITQAIADKVETK